MLNLKTILLAGIMFLAAPFVTAFAQDADTETLLDLDIVLLQQLGIDVAGEEPLTKGEYADWIAKLACLDGSSGKVSYSDVPAKYEYYSSIAAATAAGYFSGESDAVFGRDNELTYAQAVAPLIRLAGYEFYASMNGGYPDGYIAAAGVADIKVKIADPDKITRMEAAKLCADVLDTKMYLLKYDNSKLGKSNETVLSYYHDIYEGRGYMNANKYTDLYNDRGYREGYVSIDKEEYINSSDTFNGYLGYKVDFYYKEIKGESKELYAAVPSKGVNVLTVKADRDNELENGRYVYYEDGLGKKKTIKLANGYNQIVNNGTEFEPKAEDLLFETGELTFIDADSDGSYETIICKKPESMIIEGIDMFHEIIYTSAGEVSADTFDNTSYCMLNKVDESGGVKTVSIDYLQKDEILTVYRSANGKYLEAYSIENKLKGTMTQINKDEHEITVDGIKYRYLGNAANGINTGSEISMYIDYLGYVVKITETASGFKFGYLYNCGYDPDNDTIKMRIFTALGLEEMTTDKEIILDGKKIGAEAAGNDNRLIFEGSGIKRVIRYKMRGGKIYIIDTDENHGGGENDTLKCDHSREPMRYSPTFPTVAEKYRIADDTLFLIVPELESEKNDISCYGYTYTFRDYPQTYTFSVYGVDEDNKAGAVLMYPSGSRKGDAEPQTNGLVGVIYKVSEVVNEDGDIVKEVKMYTQNNKIETFYTAVDRCADFNANFGTVVLYVVEEGKLIGLKSEFTPDSDDPTKSGSSKMSFTDEWTAYFGKTKQVYGDYFSMDTSCSGKITNTADNVRVVPLNIGQNIVVDMSNRSINEGSLTNLHGESYEYVRIFRSAQVRQLIIYQY